MSKSDSILLGILIGILATLGGVIAIPALFNLIIFIGALTFDADINPGATGGVIVYGSVSSGLLFAAWKLGQKRKGSR